MSSRNKIAVLTGDVHHSGLTGYPEFNYCRQYIEVVRQCDAKCTIFLTGKCLEENHHKISELIGLDYVELGCHTYTGHFLLLGRRYSVMTLQNYATLIGLPRNVRNLLLKSYYAYDIKRTKNVFSENGFMPISWRTHAYLGNSILYSLLPIFGFRIVSDIISDKLTPFTKDGLLHAPITLADDKMFPLNFVLEHPSTAFKMFRDEILKRINKEISYLTIQLHPLYANVFGFSCMKQLIKQILESGYSFLMMKELLRWSKQNV